MTRLNATAYLAPEGFLDQLLGELRGVLSVHGRLVLAAGPAQPTLWAENIWYEPVKLPAPSIAAAAAALTAIQRNWWPYAHDHHRRLSLIQQRLPHVSAKPLVFPAPAPGAALGSFTLLSTDELLAAAHCERPFPNGQPRFVEDKIGPPSRAYLKLYEVCTLLGRHPAPGERCLELGAAPGGWTWVLGNLGCAVTAYDRAPLAPNVAAMPNVTSVVGDAFGAWPERVGPIDWLLSDIICYPERLLQFVKRWLDAGTCANFICTVKLQGSDYQPALKAFQAIPNSRLLHLYHNKHELTWIKLADV